MSTPGVFSPLHATKATGCDMDDDHLPLMVIVHHRSSVEGRSARCPSPCQVMGLALHAEEQGRQATHAQRAQGLLEAELLAAVVGRGGNGRGRRPVGTGVEETGKATP